MRLDKLFQKSTTSERTAENEVTSPEMLAACYAQAGQPVPDAGTLLKFASGELNPQHLQSHLKNIESSRTQGRIISRQELVELARYGIKNLSETRISAQVSHLERLDLSGANLSNANLDDSTFKRVNFSGANMSDVAVHNTHFDQSILNTVEMPRIRMKGDTLDLEIGGTIVATDDIWNIHKSDVYSLDTCDNCEVFNESILGMPSKKDGGTYARRGIILFQEGKPLGMLKLKGENTFLAMRTVRNIDGEVIFWKGMVYALENDMNLHLAKESRKLEEVREWRRADMESVRGETTLGGRILSGLGRNNLRFISEPSIFNRIDELVADIEAGKEEMVDIFE
ncbi:MAG: pentapeptide repeat-containing protein [Patescibacteria group bacterium]